VCSSDLSTFCAGDDLLELEHQSPNESEANEFVGRLQNITRLMMLGPKTVVCAVRGWAIGGGGAWPLNADMTVWSDDARMRFPEAQHGLFASGGATWLLQQFCGPQRAQEILLGGESLDANQLIKDGIVKKTVPVEALERETSDTVQRLLSLPAEALPRYKAARARTIEGPLLQALEVEEKTMVEATLKLIASGVLPKVKSA